MSHSMVIDTNIISYRFNKHTLWNLYRPILEGKLLILTAQSVAELRFGAIRKNWGLNRRNSLEQMMAEYTIAFPNDLICTYWATIRADSEQMGRHIDPDDAWIAATALALGIPLVTHNKKHFDFLIGLTLIFGES